MSGTGSLGRWIRNLASGMPLRRPRQALANGIVSLVDHSVRMNHSSPGLASEGGVRTDRASVVCSSPARSLASEGRVAVVSVNLASEVRVGVHSKKWVDSTANGDATI